MNKMPIESSDLAMFDQLNEKNIYCRVCSILFFADNNLMNSIHNQIRTIKHQEIIHRFFHQHFYKQQECNEDNLKEQSNKLFSLAKATRLHKNAKKQLFTYFDEKLKLIFNESILTTTSKKSYSSILRRKNNFQLNDVVDFLIIQNNDDAKSALNCLIKKSGMNKNAIMIKKYISKRLESQTSNNINIEVLNLRNNFNKYFSRYIDNLEELFFLKLVIFQCYQTQQNQIFMMLFMENMVMKEHEKEINYLTQKLDLIQN